MHPHLQALGRPRRRHAGYVIAQIDAGIDAPDPHGPSELPPHGDRPQAGVARELGCAGTAERLLGP